MRMCRMNVLLAMYPELDSKRDSLISKKVNLTIPARDGYFFLHPRDPHPTLNISERDVILDWLREASGEEH